MMNLPKIPFVLRRDSAPSIEVKPAEDENTVKMTLSLVPADAGDAADPDFADGDGDDDDDDDEMSDDDITASFVMPEFYIL